MFIYGRREIQNTTLCRPRRCRLNVVVVGIVCSIVVDLGRIVSSDLDIVAVVVDTVDAVVRREYCHRLSAR